MGRELCWRGSERGGSCHRCAIVGACKRLTWGFAPLRVLFYNLACCESLTGRTNDALEHLQRAIDMSEEFRGNAKQDTDLDPIRDQRAFRLLISDPQDALGEQQQRP